MAAVLLVLLALVCHALSAQATEFSASAVSETCDPPCASPARCVASLHGRGVCEFSDTTMCQPSRCRLSETCIVAPCSHSTPRPPDNTRQLCAVCIPRGIAAAGSQHGRRLAQADSLPELARLIDAPGWCTLGGESSCGPYQHCLPLVDVGLEHVCADVCDPAQCPSGFSCRLEPQPGCEASGPTVACRPPTAVCVAAGEKAG